MDFKDILIPYKNYVATSIFINLIIVVSILILRSSILPPQVPLFYGLAQGEEQLAPSAALTIPSLVSILILLINIAISFLFTDEFLKKTLVISGIATTFFSVITTLKIAFLVGSF